MIARRRVRPGYERRGERLQQERLSLTRYISIVRRHARMTGSK